MAPPAFADIAKSSNDVCFSLTHCRYSPSIVLKFLPGQLLTRDFYHTASGSSPIYSYKVKINGLSVKLTNLAANLEVKSKAPNGVAFTVKGKSDHKTGAIAGQVLYSELFPSIQILIISLRSRQSTPTSLPVEPPPLFIRLTSFCDLTGTLCRLDFDPSMDHLQRFGHQDRA